MPVKSMKYTLPSGRVVDLYSIGYLAESLGRSTPTIRKWEISGIIPNSMFRTSNGVRMYTDEQIDILVQCAEETNIKQGLDFKRTTFSRRAHKRMNKLKEEYFGKEETVGEKAGS